MIVHFNSTAEFLDELSNDWQLVDRCIVRVTLLRRFRESFVKLFVVATVRIRDDIVRLEDYLGFCLWADQAEQEKLGEKAKEIMDRIEKQVVLMGLEVRGGFFEQDATRGRMQKESDR